MYDHTEVSSMYECVAALPNTDNEKAMKERIRYGFHWHFVNTISVKSFLQSISHVEF